MSNFWIVLKKEIKSLLRDGSSLIISVLFPILLMPILFTIVLKNEKNENDNIYNPKIGLFLSNNNENININEDTAEFKKEFSMIKNEIFKSIDATYVLIKQKDTYDSFLKEEIDVAVYIESDFSNKINNKNPFEIEIIYNIAYTSGVKYAEYVSRAIAEYSQRETTQRLKDEGIEKNKIEPVNFKMNSIQVVYQNVKKEGLNNILLITLIPTIIIGFISFGNSSASSELFSMEKERNTFESLLSTSAKRKEILFAKLSVNGIFSFFGSIGNFLSVFILYILNLEQFSSSQIYFKFSTIIVLFLVLIGLSLLSAILSTTIYVFAKNNKNASALGALLMLVPMIVNFSIVNISFSKLSPLMFFIPFFGSIFSTRMAIIGNVSIFYLLMGLLSNLIVIAILIKLIVKRYCSEKVLKTN